MLEVYQALNTMGFDELAKQVGAQIRNEPLPEVNIHRVWGFAKDNAALCSDGYMKSCFVHVEWWMHEYNKRHR